MVNVGPGAIRLLIAGTGAQVEGRFDELQEALVLDALRNHRSVHLRVTGIAEFSTRDRQIKRLVRIESVALAPSEAASFDETAPPIWDELTRIGTEVAPGTWDAVPVNLSERIDDVVYGHGESRR